jgi:hypothetical protein
MFTLCNLEKVGLLKLRQGALLLSWLGHGRVASCVGVCALHCGVCRGGLVHAPLAGHQEITAPHRRRCACVRAG